MSDKAMKPSEVESRKIGQPVEEFLANAQQSQYIRNLETCRDAFNTVLQHARGSDLDITVGIDNGKLWFKVTEPKTVELAEAEAPKS